MHEIHGYREAGRQAIGRVWQLLENTSQVRAWQHVNVTMAVAAHLGAAGAASGGGTEFSSPASDS